MQLFTRDMVLAGPPRGVRLWATDIAERFTAITGREVETWLSVVGGRAGHTTWSVRVEGAADLLGLTEQAMADDGYVHAIEGGRAFFTEAARDTLYRPLRPLPEATTRPGNALLVSTSVARAGRLGDAVGWGLEAAELVESLIGRPTMLAAPTVGRFSQLVWMTATRDLAEADASMATINADDGYRKLLEGAEGLFVDESGRQELFLRTG